jgi:hypothetical protein
VLPRECDNDDCDYETGIRNGQPAAWWVHVNGCKGLADWLFDTPYEPWNVPNTPFRRNDADNDKLTGI